MFNLNRLVASAAVVAVVVAGSAGIARAEDTTKAREHYQKGTAYYDLGRYQDAVKEFEAAYEAKNDPALLYNLAQSHRLAGNTEQALHFYRTYLRRVPKAPNRAEIEGRITSLEKLLEEKKTTQITPPNGAIPLPGTTPTQPGGEVAPLPPPAALPPLQPAPPLPGPGTGTGPDLVATPAATDPGRTKRMAGLIIGGVGVVGIVASMLFGQGARSAAEEIETAAADFGDFTPHLQNVDKRGRTYQTLSIFSFVVGAAGIGGGAVLYYYGRKAKETAPGTVSLLPAWSPAAATATMQVTF